MKNKITTYLLTTTILLTITTNIVFGKAIVIPKNNIENSTMENTGNYITDKGTVLKIVNQNDFKRIIMKNEKDETIAYNVYPYTPIINSEGVVFGPAIGHIVQVSYNKSAHKSDTIPPQIDASAMVLLDSNNSYYAIYDDFDKNLHSSNKQKEIAITDNTMYYDINMNKITYNDIKGSKLIVFYTFATGKAPEKVYAKKVIKLKNDPQVNVKLVIKDFFDSLPEQSKYTDGEISYIKLNDIASKYGYTVTWNQQEGSIIMKSAKSSFVIKVNDKSFKYNNVNSSFTNSPILHDDRTFISLDFALDIAYSFYTL